MISLRFSRNSEAFASEFLKNLKEMFFSWLSDQQFLKILKNYHSGYVFDYITICCHMSLYKCLLLYIGKAVNSNNPITKEIINI